MDAPDLRPLHEQPQFIRAEGLAHATLILALVDVLGIKHEFRSRALVGLERLRTALLSNPVSDAQIAAVDGVEEWVKHVTS